MKFRNTALMILLASFLTACEGGPAPVAPPVETAEEAQEKHNALLLTTSSMVGALQHCKEDKIYTSPQVEDNFYRLRRVMLGLADSLIKGDRLVSSVSYGVYVRSLQQGILFTFSQPAENTPEKPYRVDETEVKTAAVCKDIEAKLKDLRKPGKLLDVVPAGPDVNPKKSLDL